MRKTICDLCQRTIKVGEKSYEIKITRAGWTEQIIDDVCEECYEKINKTISGLCKKSEMEE